ncbi:ATP-binding cassette sub-family A member [Dirofilaria immitis]
MSSGESRSTLFWRRQSSSEWNIKGSSKIFKSSNEWSTKGSNTFGMDFHLFSLNNRCENSSVYVICVYACLYMLTSEY